MSHHVLTIAQCLSLFGATPLIYMSQPLARRCQVLGGICPRSTPLRALSRWASKHMGHVAITAEYRKTRQRCWQAYTVQMPLPSVPAECCQLVTGRFADKTVRGKSVRGLVSWWRQSVRINLVKIIALKVTGKSHAVRELAASELLGSFDTHIFGQEISDCSICKISIRPLAFSHLRHLWSARLFPLLPLDVSVGSYSVKANIQTSPQ